MRVDDLQCVFNKADCIYEVHVMDQANKRVIQLDFSPMYLRQVAQLLANMCDQDFPLTVSGREES